MVWSISPNLHMVTEILLAAVANTTASTATTQNDFDIGDYTGIVAPYFYCHNFLRFF
jgi:hypothetical protein